MGRPKGSKDSIKRHIWTTDDVNYLRQIVNGRSYKEVAELINSKFGYSLTSYQAKEAIRRYGLKTGLRSKKGIDIFDPNKDKPNGEGINRGYVCLKMAKDEWVLKHRYIYEKHFGEIKKGNYVIFLDGDRTNFDINNLAEITKAQLLVMNRNKLIRNNAELTKTGIQVANLIIKANEVKRRMEK